MGVDPVVIDQVGALCAPGPGKSVTLLPDVAIPAVEAPAVAVAERRIGSSTLAAVTVDAVAIPATVAESGCVVVFEAPAGCLPRVEVSPAWIPGVRVPGFQLRQGDGTVLEIPALARPTQVAEGGVAEQVCQVRRDGFESAAHRAAILRGPLVRAPILRGAGVRGRVCEGGECAASVTVPPLTVPAVRVDAVSVPAELLPFRAIREGVHAADAGASVAYTAEAKVLFDYNRHDLRSDAAAAVDAILVDASARGLGGAVRVEGHTDNSGDAVANQRLSELRAQAVADFLQTRGIDPARLTVTGRGETAPAHPNDSDDRRARNRRVVIEFTRS